MLFVTLSVGNTVNMNQVSVIQKRADGSLLLAVIAANEIEVTNPKDIEQVKAIIENHRPEYPFRTAS